MKKWIVYLLECSDGTLYCGITNDLMKRYEAHNRGKGAKYTRGRLPAELRVWRTVGSKGDALRLEIKIKKTKKNMKEIVLAEVEDAN